MKNIIRKSSLLAVCIGLLFFAGCDKDPVLPGLTCFLTTVSHVSSDDYQTLLELTIDSEGKVSTFTLTYTAQDQGVTYTSEETYTATYDGSGRISQLDASNGYRYEFTYDANGKLTSEDFYEGAEMDSRSEYVYNSSGQLIREDVYFAHEAGLDKIYSENYEFANTGASNPTRSTSTDPTGDSYGYVEYEYDDKPTPFSELNIPLGINGGPGAPTNNVTKRTSKNNFGAVENRTFYTYQYNADGYPTSLEQKMTFPGSSRTYTDNETYTYDCK